ncbi:MAG: omega-amidase [Verrucomicrobiota bacterium]|jgi:predicted amidohydrolase
MKIYCCQLDIVWEDKPANFARARSLLAAAKPDRGSLVLLPELFATGFSMNVAALAETPGGETEQFLAGVARELNVFVLGGVLGAGAGGKGRNLSVVFSPEGREVARYLKRQPFTPGGETAAYEAGSETVLFSWGQFMVAPFICYDLRFPEHFREATRRGAQLITVISSWPVARISHWTALLRARAIENQAYVAGVNRCGSDPHLVYNGRSLIVSPKGEVLVEAGDGEMVISADVDPAALLVYRKEFPFLADMT